MCKKSTNLLPYLALGLYPSPVNQVLSSDLPIEIATFPKKAI